jgi:hypothetical protein
MDAVRSVSLRRDVLLAAALLTGFRVSDGRGQGLDISISSPKTSYVVGEPVKFEIRITNNSDSVKRIVDIEFLGSNMEYMLFEITTPDNVREIRNTKKAIIHYMYNPNYSGEPLQPGEFVLTYLYPNSSRVINSEEIYGEEHRSGRTFPRPGLYKIRAGYFVKEHQVVLKESVGGVLYSNALELEFRAPTAEEREILSAYWGGANFMADGSEIDSGSQHDVQALRSVIAKYPDHPMTKYAYFGLLRTMSTIRLDGTIVNLEEATALSEVLRRDYPQYRFVEVRKLTAGALRKAGRRSEALALYQEALSKEPGLIHYYGFMGALVYCDTGGSDGVREWENRRRRGLKEYELNLEEE